MRRYTRLIRELWSATPPARRRAIGGAIVFTLIGLALGVELGAWRAGRRFDEDLRRAPRASVVPDTKRVVFPKESPARALIVTQEARPGNSDMSYVAPARVVAMASVSSQAGEHSIIFDSPDVTSLFSTYRQAKANFLHASRNFARTKDMFDNQGATAKDLNDAENDQAAGRAVLVENTVKLRSAGYDPESLEALKPRTAWVISDIPESQIDEVQKGELVKVTFAALPNEVVTGRAESIADAIDPVTRTIKVRVVVNNSNGKLMPGMFARADFGIFEKGTVMVPVTALVSVEDKNYVFVANNDGEFEARQVNVAASSGGESVIVTSGLKASEVVVAKGAMLLKGVVFQY